MKIVMHVHIHLIITVVLKTMPFSTTKLTLSLLHLPVCIQIRLFSENIRSNEQHILGTN